MSGKARTMNQPPPLTVAVFGAGGQVGQALCRAALPNGWRTVGFDRTQADLTVPAAIEHALNRSGAAIAVNAGAYTAVDRAEAEPALAFQVNRDGPGHLAVACARRGIPLIHLSTDYVFDGRHSGAWHEDDPTGPLNVYGASKLDGERAVAAAGGRTVILRTSWVYSAVGTNFVRTMLRLGRERTTLRVVADQTGCPTAAGAIAGAIVTVAGHLVARTGPVGGIYHYCGAGTASWFAFAAAIFALAERHGRPPPRLVPINTVDYPTPARRPANSVLDCTRIEQELGVIRPFWRDSLAPVVAQIIADDRRAEGEAVPAIETEMIASKRTVS